MANVVYTEARVLLDAYIATFSTLKNIHAQIADSTFWTDANVAAYFNPKLVVFQSNSEFQPNSDFTRFQGNLQKMKDYLSEIPDELRKRQSAISALAQAATEQTTALHPDDSLPRGLRVSNAAFAEDAGNILARTAAGYFRVQRQAQAQREILGAKHAPVNPPPPEALSREFAAAGKHAMLQAVLEMTGKGCFATTTNASMLKIGSATDLCACGDREEHEDVAIPLAIWLDPINSAGSARNNAIPAASGYWASWSDGNDPTFTSKPIVFENAGATDPDTCVAAAEAYKWLCAAYPASLQNQTTHISVQQPAGVMRGTPTSVTMATAAYSWITRKPVRKNVAMFGAFRSSDGSIIGVEGGAELIGNAAVTPEIEIVVMPVANEVAAMATPMDTLCRIAIISAADIHVYLKYATEPDFNQHHLAKLHTAQVLLLTGKQELAIPLLLEVALDCPEIYTARRLLELLAFSGKAMPAVVAQNRP